MSEYLSIYLDEAGDLGFDLTKSKTSRYLIITILVCENADAVSRITRAIKLTLKNKFFDRLYELKGSDTSLAIKKYFFKKIPLANNWRLYAAIADKKTWLHHHVKNHGTELNKKALYDEVAKRLLTQIDFPKSISHVKIIVDKSKNKYEISDFDNRVIAELKKGIPDKAQISIRHRPSYEEPMLQAVDLFCWGIRRKYEREELEWYSVFSDKIAAEIEYKF